MEARGSILLALGLLTVTVLAPVAHAEPPEILIAILDTGIWTGHDEFADAQVVAWRDFIDGQPAPYDDQGHGTATASVAAGLTLGEAPGTKLIVGKVCDAEGFCYAGPMTSAIGWAADQGATVINLSIGGGVDLSGLDAMRQAVTYAESKGALVVFSAGNSPEPSTLKRFASLDNVLAVSSATESGNPTASGHSTDPEVTQAGLSVRVARLGGGTRLASGTSFAAPNVAGVAAAAQEAWFATHGELLDPWHLEDLLKRTARDAAAYPPTFEGYGFVLLDRVLDQVPLGLPAHPCDGDLMDPLVLNNCASALYVDEYTQRMREAF